MADHQAVRIVLLAALGLLGCLGPLAEDGIDPRRVFGDPSVDPTDLSEVEDDPNLANNAAAFPTELPYLKGFADGVPIRYWRIPGQAPDFIAPLYVVETLGGETQAPIIDALPGDAGYSYWWRVHRVRTTPQYRGERIWSRAAIDQGVAMGILEAPEPTETVSTCPVVHRSTRIAHRPGGPADLPPSHGFYRNQRVSLIPFESDIEVPTTTRRFPKKPVYMFQRISEVEPLSEFTSGRDLDGDNRLVSSNNVFQANNGSPDYSPLWFLVRVRTTASYRSIDTGQPDIDDHRDFLGADDTITSTVVIPPLMPEEDTLIACPIQRDPETGSL